MKTKLLSLLREGPRTILELSRLTGQSTLSVRFHLIGLPVRVEGGGESALVYLCDHSWGDLRPANAGSTVSSHGFTRARRKDSSSRSSSRHGRRDRGLHHGVYSCDHGWLTKPLTIEDYTVLSSLSHRTLRVLRLLHQGLTQAQVARKLKITRQAVHKHVKKLLKLGFVKKLSSLHGPGKARDIVYQVRRAVAAYLNMGKHTCQPQNRGDVSAPQRPLFSLHRLQLAFHIVNQSGPFTRSESFVRAYHPRGWTGYVYLLGGVRIRALPHKVIAELVDELEFDEELTAEEAVVRAIEQLKAAVDRWLDEQAAHGVEVELSHPYLLNPPEFAFRSRIVKRCLEQLREERRAMTLMRDGGAVSAEPVRLSHGVWIDDSPRESGEKAEAHIETDDPGVATEVDRALKNALSLPSFIEPLREEIRQVRALVEAGVPVQQQMYQLMGIIGQLLREVASLREELARLKGGQG